MKSVTCIALKALILSVLCVPLLAIGMAVREQTTAFELSVAKQNAPMSDAFKAMKERAKKPKKP